MTTTVAKRKKVSLDASGQIVGRIATKIAMILMGKNKPDFQRHIDTGDKVEISNIKEIRFTGKKAISKEYRHHSLHPGGLKVKTAQTLVKENPEEILIHAVSRMLPKNKMRSPRLLRIKFLKETK